ncbi:alanine--tRNA ligase-like [Phaseolus vulgaris]|uniref:alanine--tRNA ligase-like n=1 Tax=Phaseolus vulgaris TaxID=3885 RepID=UPI0035CA941E
MASWCQIFVSDIDTRMTLVGHISVKCPIQKDEVRKAQKQVAEENKPKAVIITVEKAELGASNEKALCISGVDVGVDVAAVGETVRKAMEHKVICGVICGGVAEKGDKGKVDLAEWLSNALKWWSCNGSG